MSETKLAQNEAFFYLFEGGERRCIRLHDYDVIYGYPGLYEQVVYDRLRCQSPERVREVLAGALSLAEERFSRLRVLDFGAGNGMMGAELHRESVSRVVGVDIIEAARGAAERDQPGVYDAYYVADFTKLGDNLRDEILSWSPDCLTTVAALGFGDIPTRAFMQAFALIQEDGWIAINIKETFLDRKDETGFSRLIRELIFSEFLDLYNLKRYRHRYSIDGEPLFYYALGARKTAHVPDEFLDSLDLPS
jgi:hypothetical protein